MRSDAADPAAFDVPGGIGKRADWLAAGANHRMFRDGRLVAVTSQIFALPQLFDTPTDLVRLVGPLAPEGAIITGWAAAVLHGVRRAGPTMLAPAGTPMQVCLARDDNRSPNGFATLRVALDPDDVDVVDGLGVTNLARTAYDMVRFARSVPQAVGLLDVFRFDLNERVVDLADLTLRIQRRPRGRGHPRLRQAIAMSSSRSRSIPESVLRARMMMTLDLASTDLLVNVSLLCQERVWELDLVDLTSGLAVEYDGAHHAGPMQRDTDALKDTDVRAMRLGIQRVNSVRLSQPDHRLADYLRRGQRDALLAGGRTRAGELRADGRLIELPLRDYESAGQPATLNRE